MGRHERMKRGIGMQDRDERSRGIVTRIADAFVIIKPTVPFKLGKLLTHLTEEDCSGKWVSHFFYCAYDVLANVPSTLVTTHTVKCPFFRRPTLSTNGTVHGLVPRFPLFFLRPVPSRVHKIVHKVNVNCFPFL